MPPLKVKDIPDDALPDVTELTGDTQIVAEIIGVRATLLLDEQFQSTSIRICGSRRWIINWRNKQMREDYDKGDIAYIDLARKYGVSERHVCNILNS